MDMQVLRDLYIQHKIQDYGITFRQFILDFGSTEAPKMQGKDAPDIGALIDMLLEKYASNRDTKTIASF